MSVRDEIATWGYATPEAVRHLASAGASMAWGAFGILDPFRSSLPPLYRYWPRAFADAASLRSDWAIFTMDYSYVMDIRLANIHPGQQSLFDEDDIS